LQAARLFDWTISNIFIHGYYSKREKLEELRIAARKTKDLKSDERKTSTVVQYIVYLIVFIVLLRSLNLDFEVFEYTYKGQPISFKVTSM